jgi:DNA polymerase III epsilon subunit-like protein
MIVLDIEASGKYTTGYGVWQIGAIEFENPENKFCEESRIDDEDKISEEALKIIGKTKEELRDKKKQTAKEMIKHFLGWAKKCSERTIAGHNVWWDLTFIQNKCIKYRLADELVKVLGHRVIDLHTLAQVRYYDKNKKFRTEKGISSINLSAVLGMCGMKDTRILMHDGKVIQEGKPHNALEDAELAAECLRRMLKK